MSKRKRYPVRIPRTAFGIRAQDLRVLSRRAGWARDWTAALEAMRLGPRLGRGRQYAISGQVTELAVEGTHVDATVLGSRSDPYRVTLDFAGAEGEARERIAARFAAEPMLCARLLADDLPLEIEEIFAAEGLPLAPVRGTVKTFCSCPDWAKPCKHVAAVLFLLGEEVARRPFLLSVLRGVDPDEFLPPPCAAERPSAPPEDFASAEPTASDAGALVRRLGPIPFWRGTSRCVDTLVRVAGRVAPVAERAARGESIDLRA